MPSLSMLNVLPTPGAYPKNSLRTGSFLRGAASSSHCSGVLDIRMYYPHIRSEVESSARTSHVKLPFQNAILRLVSCIAIVAGIVLVFSRLLHVNLTTVGFSFLLAVLLISTTWGFRYATFTAVLATAAYNFFFLPPRFKFTIADPQNWIALFGFLVTAGVASHLSERARRGTEYADQRRREVERLYAFSQQLWLS